MGKKETKSSFRFKKNRLRPYKKVVKTIHAYSTDLDYVKDQYDKRQEPWQLDWYTPRNYTLYGTTGLVIVV